MPSSTPFARPGLASKGLVAFAVGACTEEPSPFRMGGAAPLSVCVRGGTIQGRWGRVHIISRNLVILRRPDGGFVRLRPAAGRTKDAGTQWEPCGGWGDDHFLMAF